MAFNAVVKVNGDTKSYEISPAVKKFTLRDMGFVETKAGNYAYEQPLDPHSPYNKTFKLKMMVASDLSGFKMSITTDNGMQKVNIFNKEEHAAAVEQFRFAMDNLISRNILKPND